MRSWSFPLGKPFGVELRVHGLFLMMLFLSAISVWSEGLNGWRGVTMWLLVLFAVLVRETARAITAATFHIEVRSVLLLPIGGLQSLADSESEAEARKPRPQYTLAASGPLANFTVAALLAGLLLGSSPGISLLAHPWVSPQHLLRTAVWFNIVLGLIQLIPVFPLDAGRILRDSSVAKHGAAEASKAAVSMGRLLGSTAAAFGLALLLFPNVPLAVAASPWLILCGTFVAMGAQLDDQGGVFQSVIDTVAMRDVMLTNFSTVFPSDTLQDALEKAIHTLQDDFPVIRGDRIIGVVSRNAILHSLRHRGDGYVQGVMIRNFLVATPDESVGTIMSRMRESRTGMIPVADEEGRVLGMVTLQNLRQSVVPLLEQRKLRELAEGKNRR